MKQLVIAVIGCLLASLLFASCEVNTQDWRAKMVNSGNIVIMSNLERGYKAGDTIRNGQARIVLLELVRK